MIFVHDKGGMCNNILQYGHLYAWGREHGQKTMSIRFSHKYHYFHICDTKYHCFLCYIVAKYAAKWKIIPTARFDRGKTDYSHEEYLMKHKHYIYATGWYACWYDLFLKYLDEIKALFTFRQEIEQRVLSIMGRNDFIKVGIHIRRGDYKTFEGGRNYFTDEQYMHFIQNFISLFPERKIYFYICSNDPDLDKDYFIYQLSSYQVFFPNGSPGEDLCLLSHCDYLIGARSTFSLVAAMYRNLPIYWIENVDDQLTIDSFKKFDYYFQDIH